MEKDSRIYIAGHTGLVGSAIHRKLLGDGYTNIITKKHSELDLTNQRATKDFFIAYKPEYVFLAAATVGGILANNNNKAKFIYDNLMIQTNVIDSAFDSGCEKLLFLGSSCIYPKNSQTPIKEDSLLTGPLEPTNDAYAIAKIAGIKMCQSYREQYGFNVISLMPTNVYGPRDNYNKYTSHVMAALICKFHDGKRFNKPVVECWGDGSPKREFLYVDDLADACFFCMEKYDSSEPINVGVGYEISIYDLASKISSMIGYEGEIMWNKNLPNGTQSKVLDIRRLRNLGWIGPYVSLNHGIKLTYIDYVENLKKVLTG